MDVKSILDKMADLLDDAPEAIDSINRIDVDDLRTINDTLSNLRDLVEDAMEEVEKGGAA